MLPAALMTGTWRTTACKSRSNEGALLSHCYKLVIVLLVCICVSLPAAAQAGATNAGVTRFASVAEPNETIAAGDLVRVISYYGTWLLVCDNRLSTHRRVCAIEQNLASGNVSLQWRIGLTGDGKPALAFDVSKAVDEEAGLTLRVGKFATTIPFESCVATCRAVIPFDGFIQQGVLNGDFVGFAFTIAGASKAMAADMNGFKEVLAAAQRPIELVAPRRDSATKPVKEAPKAKPKAAPTQVAQ
jgi:hypothetical protein